MGLANLELEDSMSIPGNVESLHIIAHQNSYFIVLQSDGNLFTFSRLKSNPLHLDNPIWSFTENTLRWKIFKENDHLIWLSAMELDDKSYRHMSFAVIRKLSFDQFIEEYAGDIGILQVEVLDSFIPGSCDHPLHCQFELYEPAIKRVTVSNNGTIAIHNFAYFTNATGGMFCAVRRNMRYFEQLIEPGGTFTFLDSIYPYYGPVATIDDYSFVQIPNHRLDKNIENNRASVELYTTSVLTPSQKNEIFVYPNPTAHKIRFKQPVKPGSVISILGQDGMLISMKLVSGTECSVEDLTSGLYYIRVNTGTDIIIARLVKL